MTLVSVVVCSYNSADTLATALESVLDQSLPSDDYEVLLVDDGSTDNTSEIADKYSRRFCNFRYVQFPTNKGLVAACNYSIKAVLGKYFIRLDADDRFDSKILATFLEPLETGTTDLVYCDRYEVDLQNGSKRIVDVNPFNLFDLIAIGVMMRTDSLRRIGGYRELFWEEFDLYIRYLQQSEMPPIRIPKPLLEYSRHPSSMTADYERVSKGWKQLRDIWGDDVLKGYGWRGLEQEMQT